MKDTIVVVANPWDADTVHILSFDSNGRYHEIGRFGNFLDVGMTFISNYLILLNYYGNLPIIFDLQNPADPQLVYNGVEPDFWSGFFFKNDLILEPLSGSATGTVTYKVVDLSDPSHPQSKGEFSADSHLGQVINDSTAVGTYYFHYSANSVLSGNMSTGFRTVAIVSEGTGADAFGGSAPPYFIIGGRLWKLQE